MLPESLLRYSCTQGIIIPRYLDERDYPWLRLLIEEYFRFVDAPKIELLQHLKRPLPFVSPAGKRALAIHVLNQMFRAEVRSKISPKKIRAALFETAANTDSPRDSIVAEVSHGLGLERNELENSLFCDLPNERRLRKPEVELQPNTIALRANSLLIQSFLARAMSVRIKLEGSARLVVRHAKLRGLICELSKDSSPEGAILTISGPYSLFRRTLLYGRALGELLPQLAWCNRFRLKARCVVGERESILEVSSGDPVFPSKTPKRFDSKVEERFARSFLRSVKDWDLVREPEPIQAGGTLIFPDFLLREKADPNNTWFLEIVGFWMPDYLQRKMAKLREANLRHFILCVDDSLNCSDSEIPKEAHLVRFHGTIDIECIKRIIERAV